MRVTTEVAGRVATCLPELPSFQDFQFSCLRRADAGSALGSAAASDAAGGHEARGCLYNMADVGQNTNLCGHSAAA